MAAEVDGRWSAICCRRAVAMFIAGGREEGGVEPLTRCGILYPLFLSDSANPDTNVERFGPATLIGN